MDRRAVGSRSQIRFAGTGGHSARRFIAVGAEEDVVSPSIRPQQQPKFGKAVGELHAIDVVTTGTDPAKEDRIHRAECVEYRLQFGSLTADLRSQ